MFRITIEIPSDGLTAKRIQQLAEFENQPGVAFRFAEVQDRKTSRRYAITIPSDRVGQVVAEMGSLTIKARVLQAIADKALSFEQVATVVGKSDLSIRNALSDLKQEGLIESISLEG